MNGNKYMQFGSLSSCIGMREEFFCQKLPIYEVLLLMHPEREKKREQPVLMLIHPNAPLSECQLIFKECT